MMKSCRECRKDVADSAPICPNCGAPRPALPVFNGYGFEWKSEAEFLGMPVIHISFKYTANRRPVPARGVIAIGQFAFGVVTISQFGIGLISLGQFVLSGVAVAQFACAVSAIAQMAVVVMGGRGQLIFRLLGL